MTTGTLRKPRSDGQRNREVIVHVAREHFREHGASASLDAIAKASSVGPGTLYRHFPSRDDLIAAVLELRDDDLIHRLQEIEQLDDAELALTEWMDAVEVYLHTLNDLVIPVGQALSAKNSRIAVSCQWLICASERFLTAAQQAAVAAPDLRGKDLLYAAFAVAWARRAAGPDAASADAVRRVMMRGVRQV